LAGYGPNTAHYADQDFRQCRRCRPLSIWLFAGCIAKPIPATDTTPETVVFATSQETIIIPQAAYNSAYNVTNLPADAQFAYVQLDENDKTFQPIDKDGILQPAVTLPLEPKAMHDEMSGVYDEYGRMSGMLGLTSHKATSINAPFIAYGYSSPDGLFIYGGLIQRDRITEDGTQSADHTTA
jgi:hypothetical protein